MKLVTVSSVCPFIFICVYATGVVCHQLGLLGTDLQKEKGRGGRGTEKGEKERETKQREGRERETRQREKEVERAREIEIRQRRGGEIRQREREGERVRERD